jgi:histidine phosphotransferase ChpT
MPDPKALDLVALICSKLCHDLAGAIGAVNNGAELLADEKDDVMREEAIGLIAQSAAEAARRLTFFRLALGASGRVDEPMPCADLVRAALDYFGNGRVKLEAPPTGLLPASLPKPLGKAMLLGLHALAQGLPRGGMLGISISGNGYRLAAQGQPLRLPEVLGMALTEGDGAEVSDPGAALARHAADLVRAAGWRLALEADGSQIALVLQPAA